MKKILFAMFMALTFVMNAKANVSDYVGEYYGTLSNIMMNNKTGYADQTMSFFITAMVNFMEKLVRLARCQVRLP